MKFKITQFDIVVAICLAIIFAITTTIITFNFNMGRSQINNQITTIVILKDQNALLKENITRTYNHNKNNANKYKEY